MFSEAGIGLLPFCTRYLRKRKNTLVTARPGSSQLSAPREPLGLTDALGGLALAMQVVNRNQLWERYPQSCFLDRRGEKTCQV
jgi:hypothetical protein